MYGQCWLWGCCDGSVTISLKSHLPVPIVVCNNNADRPGVLGPERVLMKLEGCSSPARDRVSCVCWMCRGSIPPSPWMGTVGVD